MTIPASREDEWVTFMDSIMDAADNTEALEMVDEQQQLVTTVIELASDEQYASLPDRWWLSDVVESVVDVLTTIPFAREWEDESEADLDTVDDRAEFDMQFTYPMQKMLDHVWSWEDSLLRMQSLGCSEQCVLLFSPTEHERELFAKCDELSGGY